MYTHNIDPVALQLGPIAIHWYGIMYVVAFLGAWFFLHWCSKKGTLNLTKEQVESFLSYLTLGVIIGGRLGYVLFYDLSRYLADPLSIVAVWQGGMSFHGGLIGVGIGAWLFSRKHKVSLLHIIDAFTVPAMLGQGFGRIGNFINGELFGRVTDLPWAMAFPASGDSLARHPSQLYEAAYNFAFALIIFLYRKKMPAEGRQLGLYLLLYGIGRALVEFVRVPDYFVGPLTAGQLFSIPMILVGAWLLFRRHSAETPTGTPKAS